MRYYFAPMEGITGYIYRNAYQKYFHNVDRYYTPFLAPNKNRQFSSKEINDVLPAHNKGIPLVPQILTNQAEDFIWAAKELEQMGYTEVNLNLGCPSSTVVTKKKGAGFLAVPDQLEHFFEKIFSALTISISVKTRSGITQPEEFVDLLDLYNQFPICELIVHPRTQKEQYQNKPDWTAFQQAVEISRHPLCYNGDLFTATDYQIFCQQFPQTEAVMLGRGILKNPGLVDCLKRGPVLEVSVLRQFHDQLLNQYQQVFFGDKPVLCKMKELWGYLLPLFQDGTAYAKKLKKAERIKDYQHIVESLWQSGLKS